MDSLSSIKEMVGQTAQANSNPAYGTRSLDLGSVSEGGTPSSPSPLVSSINSIPSYTPPPQQNLPDFKSLGLPGPTNPSMPPTGSIGGSGLSGGGFTSNPNSSSPFFNFGFSNQPFSSPGYNTNKANEAPQQGTGSSNTFLPLISGPDTPGSSEGYTA